MKRLLLALCLLPALASAQTAAPTAQPTGADKIFQSIYQTEWTWRTQQSSGGDEDGDPNAAASNTHLPDVSPQAQAKQLGANAVINIRFSTSNIAAGAAELLAYGTAVVIERTGP